MTTQTTLTPGAYHVAGVTLHITGNAGSRQIVSYDLADGTSRQAFAWLRAGEAQAWPGIVDRFPAARAAQVALAALLASSQAQVEQAMERYAALSGRCAICNRTLSNIRSMRRGIGPECAGKVA